MSSNSTAGSRRWLVSQFGAREHYAIGRALARRGRLETLYTDAWCRFGRRTLEKGPLVVRAFAERWHEELRAENVVAFNARSVASRLALRGAGEDSQPLVRLRMWKAYAETVAQHLRRQPLDPDRHAFFGYFRASLEIQTMLGECGIPRVLDQAAPGELEERMVEEERKLWPGWEPERPPVPDVLWQRQRSEWNAAERIVVNSDWSRRALVRQGVPVDKIAVIPLAYEGPNLIHPRPIAKGPLTVLWLGSVILRKGIPYLLEAARIAGPRLRFVVAGVLGIKRAAAATAPPNVSFLPHVSRARTTELYSTADVFVLPTISDGFALTQLEAMAHGLPVVATPNCGDVVRDGHDGFIVPVRDSGALARAVLRLEDDRPLLAEMSANALRRARDFTIDRLADQLEALSLELRT